MWFCGGARVPPSCREAGLGCSFGVPGGGAGLPRPQGWAPAATHSLLGHAAAADSVPKGKKAKMYHAGLIIPVLKCRFY